MSTRAASVPHLRSSESSAATGVLALSYSDAEAYQSYGDPTPIDYKRSERLRLAQAYIYKVKGRLSEKEYSRLLRALDAHGKSANVDQTREEVAKVFEAANEYELWEEFLECFLTRWLHAQWRKEERDGVRAQFRAWEKTAFK